MKTRRVLGRWELLGWLNDFLCLDLSKVMQCTYTVCLSVFLSALPAPLCLQCLQCNGADFRTLVTLKTLNTMHLGSARVTHPLREADSVTVLGTVTG